MTKTVNPTLTDVAVVDVRSIGLLTLQVQNLDPTQTASGFIQTRVAASMGRATSTLADFASILPAGSVDVDGNPTDCVSADIDCAGLAEVALVMRMNGLGGDVQYAARKAGPKK